MDDDQRIIDSLSLLLEDKYNLLSSKTGIEALNTCCKEKPDLILLDINLPGEINGLEVLKRIKLSNKNLPIIMISVIDKIETAIKAIKLGAHHYITKPFDQSQLHFHIANALQKPEPAIEELNKNSPNSSNIIGKSRHMQLVRSLVKKVSKTNSTVFLYGESGTGKEVIAKEILLQSQRKNQPFIAVNCSAFPDQLIESELFGFEKGSFTNAEYSKLGKFELANNGTLFLDEIASLKLEMQSKLLRVLEEREIERIGGTKTIPVNVRIITASNIDLKNKVKTGEFRLDLFHRLNIVPINLPPLRERPEDIPEFIHFYLSQFKNTIKNELKGITTEAIYYLQKYQWPGNVRELKNLLERMVVMTESDILTTEDIPLELFIPDITQNKISSESILKKATADYEKLLINNTLLKTNGNQTNAANLLGIHRNTLIQKINLYHIKQSTENKSNCEIISIK